jgi:GT2 family glycosyltransferase
VSSRPAPVEVVIVHRNRPQRCATTVEAFRSQPLDVSVTVIDNGSTREARESLRRTLPDVDVITLGHNAGFGPGANVGIRRWLDRGSGEWVVVAPDDAVPQPGCLARLLVEVEARSDVGLASAEFGPDFDYLPAVDWVVGGYYRPAHRGLGFEEADYPHGTLLLARRAALVDIGLFDERYFAYCEEVDLGLRARRRGWRVGIVWGAVVSNERSPDRVVADYLQLRNTLLLVRTWFGRYPASVRWVYAAGQVLYRAARRGPAEFGHRRVEVRALTDFARGRFGPPPLLPSRADDLTGVGWRRRRRAGPAPATMSRAGRRGRRQATTHQATRRSPPWPH